MIHTIMPVTTGSTIRPAARAQTRPSFKLEARTGGYRIIARSRRLYEDMDTARAERGGKRFNHAHFKTSR
jgi:hypothetical protein